MRNRLRRWRRRWCLWRRHPMAEWSPIVRHRPARYGEVDGRIVMKVDEITVRQWRCAIHERPNR